MRSVLGFRRGFGARRGAAVVAPVLAACLLTSAAGFPAGAERDGRCAGMERLRVPGAAHQQRSCLPELTTAGTVSSGHTDPADWSGLTPAGLPTPRGVPGIQIDGYFPDDSHTNNTHGWNHDSQFVIRLPDDFNGGLVVSGSPGNRQQYANDRAIADWVLARGYAFAATDKGNTGLDFHRDGERPGDAIAEWNRRVTQLTIAAKAVVAQRYGRAPQNTLVTGLSNGGYLVRWQLENRPGLYDGGVDWEGTLWRVQAPNLLGYLPKALRAYPRYADGGSDADEAHAAMIEAGFAPGSEFLWPYHHEIYWELTQRIYRKELDPSYQGEPADYDYSARKDIVAPAIEKIALTGRIKRPLITIHGTLDTLLPIGTDSDLYADMVREEGRNSLYRYYRIEGGNHVDGLVDEFPKRLRPLTPCHRSAFVALESWLAQGVQPPPSGTVARPADATPAELLTRCRLG
ncbi:3-hydroxybutyrate oligomer hydrolase family protein [Haloactinomyces albus]|uniref:Esterase n=1 Tax=Haloactinomyces albus TaxID=1352928 RepID=A0AAE3ZJ90_9ACTN|nr:3-hydroxybutyrate oligomer hydrolase family protein [Haloactinomyces albus]MDR7303914.1 putative esterase [Haloactinomyces albus]